MELREASLANVSGEKVGERSSDRVESALGQLHTKKRNA
jgi:hypothetical protein